MRKRSIDINLVETACPNCGKSISRNIQKQLSPFLQIIGEADCEGCGKRIRWHRDLHPKMILGGRVFQFGLLLIFISSVLKIFMNAAILEILLLGGLAVMLVGTLISYTNSNKIRVELLES